jgi:nucleoside-diphosphate-sugar epimerase
MIIGKTLVTGASGLIGSYLVRELVNQGDQVVALVRENSDLSLLRGTLDHIEIRIGDLRDYYSLEDALEGVSKVYHCAAMVSFDDRDREELIKTNVEGTANLVNLCLEMGVKKLVHVSSIAALGKKEGNYVNEEDYWQNNADNNYYALSKFLSEQEVWRAYAEGLPVAIVNPSIVLGSGFWHVGSNKFFGQAWDRFPFYTRGVGAFVDVRDVVKAMVLCMEKEYTGQRFILNAACVPYKQFMEECSLAVGKKGPSIAVGNFTSGIIWRVAHWKSKILGGRPFLTRITARAAQSRFQIDNRKSRELLKIEYRNISKTLQEIGKQYLDSKKLNAHFAIFEQQ